MGGSMLHLILNEDLHPDRVGSRFYMTVWREQGVEDIELPLIGMGEQLGPDTLWVPRKAEHSNYNRDIFRINDILTGQINDMYACIDYFMETQVHRDALHPIDSESIMYIMASVLTTTLRMNEEEGVGSVGNNRYDHEKILQARECVKAIRHMSRFDPKLFTKEHI